MAPNDRASTEAAAAPARPEPRRLSRNARGIAWMLACTLCFAAGHTSIRYVSNEVHPFEVAFFRSFFGFLLMLPWVAPRRFAALRTKRFGAHVLRVSFNAGFMLAFFLALSLAPIAQVTALSFAGPVFATVLAMFLLRERFDLARFLALVASVAGALVIVRPGYIPFNFGFVLILFAACMYGAVTVTIKSLTRTESSLTIGAYMALLLAPITFVFALPFWTWPSWHGLMWLGIVSGLATLAQLLLTQAIREGDATVVMPVDFARLVWASMFGALLLGEVPDIWVWIGGLLIFGSATFLGIREARAGGKTPG